MRKCGKIERVYHGWGRPFGGGSGDWRGGYGASLEDRKAVMKKVLSLNSVFPVWLCLFFK
jgi:hypothetical protein